MDAICGTESCAICGCGHHYSFHDGKGCHERMRYELDWDKDGKPVRWALGWCKCVSYTGPEPVPRWLEPLESPPPHPPR
jgi:hypothetical protein